MARSYELTEAIAALIQKQPFFAVLLLDLMEIQETEAIERAATDGKYIYINPKWFKEGCRNTHERIFVLAHEISHVILEHLKRLKYYKDLGVGPDLKTFSPGKANHAMDYIINDALINDNVGKPPIGVLINPQFDRTMIWDEVYEQLPDDQDPPGQSGFDQHMDPDPNSAPSKAQIQRAVQGAASAAKSQGKMPGSMQRFVDELCDPQVPWNEHLRRAVATLSGRDTQTWARPNRRRLAVAPHVYWPGTMGMHAGSVLLINDTSGSVSDKEQAVYFSEVHAMLSDMAPEHVWLMFVDAELQGFHELHDVNDLLAVKTQVKGGGGTDMTVGFREMEEMGLRPSTVIVFTDGYTPFGEDTGVPTIWCITSDAKAPWGLTINVKIPH
jgi:predicted metal-dependent peptidase